ncbi:hypothetical protein NDU88_002770 [Pleurodeles waltl]|uniref:Uncharacterized protein n=1 Tax=Pleurodeles waltl TaxID=8319 RepID=A0AAV7VFI7_PLEWA|nr:hypothetical protein NDU88_002770 [Pleurodeles waltl]
MVLHLLWPAGPATPSKHQALVAVVAGSLTSHVGFPATAPPPARAVTLIPGGVRFFTADAVRPSPALRGREGQALASVPLHTAACPHWIEHLFPSPMQAARPRHQLRRPHRAPLRLQASPSLRPAVPQEPGP